MALLAVTCLLPTASLAADPGLLRFTPPVGQIQGYVRPDGVLLPFSQTSPFDAKGMALVRQGAQFGFIDRQGNFPVPLTDYAALGRFEHDLARAKVKAVAQAPSFRTPPEKSWGFLDRQGQWAIAPQFVDVGPVASNGLIAAAVDGGPLPVPPWRRTLWGYIDRKGQWVIEPRYQRADPFAQNGLALVILREDAWRASHAGNNMHGLPQWALIDATGQMKIGPNYGEPPKPLGGKGWTSIGYAPGGALYGWEQKVADPRWFLFDDRQTQRLTLQRIITPSGKLLSLAPWRLAGLSERPIRDRLVIADADNQLGLIDADGKLLLKPRFYGIEAFGDGFLAAHDMHQKRYSVLDKNGKVLQEITTDSPLSVYNPKAQHDPVWLEFSENGKHGLIASIGTLLAPGRYESLKWDEASGRITVSQDGREGLLDPNGKLLGFLPPGSQFLGLIPQNGELLAFCTEVPQRGCARHGLADIHGRVVLPATYDELRWTALNVGIVGVDGPGEYGWRDRRYGVIDDKGQWIVEPKYQSIGALGAFLQFTLPGTPDNERRRPLMNAQGQILDLSAYSDYSVLENPQTRLTPKSHFLIVKTSRKEGHYMIDTGWGLIDTRGRLVIPLSPQVLSDLRGEPELLSFYDQNTRRYGLVGLDGKVRLNAELEDDNIHFAPNGLARVKRSEKVGEYGRREKYGYLDRQFRWTIPPDFYDAKPFGDNGLAEVRLHPDREQSDISLKAWIDAKGRVVIPQLAPFVQNRKIGLKDAAGKVVIPPDYTLRGFEPNGTATLSRDKKGETQWAVIDAHGKFLTDFDNHSARFWESNGLTLLEGNPRQTHTVLVGKNGATLAVAKADTDVPAASPYIVIEGKDEKQGLADEAAKIVLPIDYYTLGYPDAEGFIPARQNRQSGYVSLSGQWKLAARFDDVKAFSPNGLAPACGPAEPGDKHCRWGYIDRQGHWKIPPQFGEAEGFAPNGLAPVADYSRPKEQHETRYNAWGLVNETGQVVTPFLFYDLERRGNFWVGERQFGDAKGSWTTHAIINRQGKIVKDGLSQVGNRPYRPNQGWTRFQTADDARGNALFSYDGNNGMTDDDGNILVKPQYDFVQPHEAAGLIEVWDGGKVRFIHPDGKTAFTVQDFRYEKPGAGSKLKMRIWMKMMEGR
ncbi:MAG: WG repeat-containing protein [Zoogloeaceae bacterium]|nr:WG repeat-containing protein [Zoogloeaceae bacterium]